MYQYTKPIITVSNLPTIGKLQARNQTKGELAADLMGDISFDTALPQAWLDQFAWDSHYQYAFILSTIVWAYPEDSMAGQPAPLCEEMAAELARLNYQYLGAK